MENLVKNLNCLLSDLNVFYRKLQNYHWNVKGKDFFIMHTKLEEYYNEINEQIDELAEHILMLNNEPLGTMKDYLNNDSRVILVSKGLEKDTDLLMTEIYKELNLKGNVSYLAGPTFAKEFIVNSKAGLTLGTKDERTKELMLSLFKDTNIEFELWGDFELSN